MEKMTSAEKGSRNGVNNNNTNNNNNVCNKHGHGKTNWNTKASNNKTPHTRCPKHHHKSRQCRKSESVLSTDSDIRFTRRKLGDSQKCGCVVIAGFLVALLLAAVFVYLGYTYLRPEPLPLRVFRGRFRVINGDTWTMDLADQNSLRFQHKSRDYRERINLIIRRSDLRTPFEGSEVLALDGIEDKNDLLVHFNLIFDPYRGLVSTADLLSIFSEEIVSKNSKYFGNLTIDASSLVIKEVTGMIEEPNVTPVASNSNEEVVVYPTTTPPPPRICESIRLGYCSSIGYNSTTFPNLLGHLSIEEVEADVIAFRELVDAECFREAFDFVCRLLQPPCEVHEPFEPTPRLVCREYCQIFLKGCGDRVPKRFKKYFDCESFPESTSIQSCHSKPGCSDDLQSNALSSRLCDGIADCPDLSDENTCTFCPPGFLYCGRGRACISKRQRCDGKLDCPDGSDEKDCLSIAPLITYLTNPSPLVPYLPKFYSEGYAIFSEKGSTGKLCAEGLESSSKSIIRHTVAESLCKSLSYESVKFVEIRNDTEYLTDYVRVLDPHAAEISFVRTGCQEKQVLYVGCVDLQCGIQSVQSGKEGKSLPKMANPGDWPWLVALYREDTHVCDGTLISADWVLTTESCFQGQPKATWLAIFGAVRLNANAPWTQRRRIIGMVKSPVEGSTAALIRLETSVVFTDFVRPICLPDELTRKLKSDVGQYDMTSSRIPKAERLGSEMNSTNSDYLVRRLPLKETHQFFISPVIKDDITAERSEKLESDERLDNIESMPRAEALTQFENYPLPEKTPQTQYYAEIQQNVSPNPMPLSYVTSRIIDQTWINCNTLGWSRQRDHLQRVQLKIGDMAPCENISIATVNSMCTEATYQKYDCTEEEFAGTPVQCLIPDTNQWALVGVSSWRIACAPTGIERPRMYDKITSNSAWIRDTIKAI